MMTVLSVVIATYNGEKFIASALRSVRDQYDDGIDIVLIDDGSSDRTIEIITEFSKTLPIRLIRLGRIANWVAATNIGLHEAKGDWACILHQDDLWLPGRIAKLRTEMARAPGAMVLTDAVFIGPDEEQLGPWTCPLAQGDVPSHQFVERLLVQNFVAVASPAFRRKAVLDFGGLDESLWFTADWDLWLRLGATGPVRFLPDRLTAFRVHPESQTISRRLARNEWRHQLTTVLNRHLPRWAAEGRRRESVERVAFASVSVNSMLAAASRGEEVQLAPVLIQLLRLGPLGWHRYVRDSRIIQRLKARIKLSYQENHAA